MRKRNPIATQLRNGYYKPKVVVDKKKKASKNTCRKQPKEVAEK